MARTAEASGTVMVSRRQVVTFTGRHLASVELTSNGLVVTKKRDRGGRYDSHTFPLTHVVAFVEGQGGRREPAYASVITTTVIKKVFGDISYDQGWTVVTDKDGTEHRFRSLSDTDLVVIEEAEKPERATRSGSKKKKPARKTRETDEDDGEDAEDDGDDLEEDATEDGDGDDLEDDGEDAEDAEDDGEDVEADDDEEEEPVVRKKPQQKSKEKKPVGKGKTGKPGRRISSF